jgi:hypothetical protein
MSKNNRYNREFRNREEKSEEIIQEELKKEKEFLNNAKEELKEEKDEVIEKEAPPTKEPKKGHVIAQLLNVRTEPVKGDNIIGQLPKGTSIEIITEEKEGWFFIKGEIITGVSVSGYVMSEYIKED